MFRGAGYSLLARFGQVVAILVVGVTFGLVHGLVYGLAALTVFGIGLAWLRAKTESVYPCIVIHCLFNAVALVFAVTEGIYARAMRAALVTAVFVVAAAPRLRGPAARR